MKLAKLLAAGLAVATITTGGITANASTGDISLYYTYGAPSGDNQMVNYGGYTALGRDYAKLVLSTFSVNYTGPYVTISQPSCALNFSSANSAGTYRPQYVNGRKSVRGSYVSSTQYLNNYSGQRTVTIFGSIGEP